MAHFVMATICIRGIVLGHIYASVFDCMRLRTKNLSASNGGVDANNPSILASLNS